jgi:hypothetical protein
LIKHQASENRLKQANASQTGNEITKKKYKFRYDNKKQAISMHKNISKTSKQAQELHKMAIKSIIYMSEE